MFTLTSAAAQQIHQSAMASAAHEMSLRVAARQAPDGSIEYGMGFDEAQDRGVVVGVMRHVARLGKR